MMVSKSYLGGDLSAYSALFATLLECGPAVVVPELPMPDPWCVVLLPSPVVLLEPKWLPSRSLSILGLGGLCQ